MEKIMGIGGIGFTAKDPKALAAWYQEFLGIQFGYNSYTSFAPVSPNNINNSGQTIFSFFKENTEYFKPSAKDFMINLRV